jgi:hypothetical protein
VYAQRRLGLPGDYAGDGGSAGAGPGGLGFADSALEEPHVDIPFINFIYNLNINPMLEMSVASDISSF